MGVRASLLRLWPLSPVASSAHRSYDEAACTFAIPVGAYTGCLRIRCTNICIRAKTGTIYYDSLQ